MSDSIDYQEKLDGALRLVVREVLADVAREGLPGDHHFFLTFCTEAPNVKMSDWLREQYPEEMTVILQHQFWNLRSTEDGFAVTLRFSGVEERLEVPWDALTVFADPSVEFGLQLRSPHEMTLEPPAETERAPVEASVGVEADVVHIEDFRR